LIVILGILVGFSSNATYYKDAITFKDFNKYNSNSLFMANSRGAGEFPLDETKMEHLEKGSVFIACDDTGTNPWVIPKGRRTPVPLWEKTTHFDSCGMSSLSRLYKLNEKQALFKIGFSNDYFITDGTPEGTKPWDISKKIEGALSSNYDHIQQLSNGNYVFANDYFTLSFYDASFQQAFSISHPILTHPEYLHKSYIGKNKAIIVTNRNVYTSDGTIDGFKKLSSIPINKVDSLLYKTENTFYFYETTDDSFLLYRLDLITDDFETVYEGPRISVKEHFGIIGNDRGIYFVALRPPKDDEGQWPLLNLYKFSRQHNSLDLLHDDDLKTANELRIYETKDNIFINKIEVSYGNEYFSLITDTNELMAVKNVSDQYNQSQNIFLGKSDSKLYFHPRNIENLGSVLTVYDFSTNSFDNNILSSSSRYFDTFIHDNELFLAHDNNSETMHAGYYVYNGLTEDIDHAFTIHKNLLNQGSRFSRPLETFDNIVTGGGIRRDFQSSSEQYDYWLMNEELSVTSIMNQSLSEGVDINSDIIIDLVVGDNLIFSVGSKLKDRNTFKYDVNNRQLTKLYSSVQSDDDSNKINRVIGYIDDTLFVETKSREAGLINIAESQMKIIDTPKHFYMFQCGNKFLYSLQSTEEVFEVLPTAEVNILNGVERVGNFNELELMLMPYSTPAQIYNCQADKFTSLVETSVGAEIPRISPASWLVSNEYLYFETTLPSPYRHKLYRYNSLNGHTDYIGEYDDYFDRLHINSTGVYYSKFDAENNETTIYQMINGSLSQVLTYPQELRFLKTHPQDQKGWIFFSGTELTGSLHTKLFIFMPDHNEIVEVDLFANAPWTNDNFARLGGSNGYWEYVNGYHYIDYQTHFFGSELLILSSSCIEQLAIFKNSHCANGFANNLPDYYVTHDVDAVPNKYVYIPTRALDIDGDKLEYSLKGAPEWLTIDSQSGEITGTVPGNAYSQVFNMEVTISDGYDMVSTNEFSLNIQGTKKESTLPATNTPANTGGGGGTINVTLLFILILLIYMKLRSKTKYVVTYNIIRRH
jgi:hypothetical protein